MNGKIAKKGLIFASQGPIPLSHKPLADNSTKTVAKFSLAKRIVLEPVNI